MPEARSTCSLSMASERTDRLRKRPTTEYAGDSARSVRERRVRRWQRFRLVRLQLKWMEEPKRQMRWSWLMRLRGFSWLPPWFRSDVSFITIRRHSTVNSSDPGHEAFDRIPQRPTTQRNWRITSHETIDFDSYFFSGIRDDCASSCAGSHNHQCANCCRQRQRDRA